MGLHLQSTTRDHRKSAAAVLEVLAGTRTPTQAAQDLSLSLPAYYKLEQRAIQGLVEGCLPPARGPHLSPQRELDKMRKQQEKLQRELHRQQALTRAAQRAVGLSSPPEPQGPPGAAKLRTASASGGGKRRRKPMTRALKAVQVLRQHNDQPTQAQGQAPAVAGIAAGSPG